MAEKEQVHPLAPASVKPLSDGETAGDSSDKTRQRSRRRRNHIRCMGCVVATCLVLTVTVLILAFTVFRVKKPTIRMNSMTVTSLDVSFGPQILRPLINVSMVADVSVKNPNVASFRFGNTTTGVYYRGKQVGEGHGPPGEASARRTMRTNVSIDFMADRLLSSGLDLVRDVGSGTLNVTTYTRVGGKVSILGIVKKHATVKMNCTVVVSISSQKVQGFNCKRDVDL